SQSSDLVSALKQCLRAKGLGYRDVGQALGLSEASVKRIFSRRTFTLARLEEICRLLDMSLYDLARLTRLESADEVTHLSLEQEQALADDPIVLTYFYLLLTGRTPKKIAAEFGLDDRQQATMLARLSRLRLVELYPVNNGRLLTGRRIEWRKDGPIRKLYQKQVAEAFMSSRFAGRDEVLGFDTGELSEASVKILLRKIERLGREFDDLVDLDISMPVA